MTSTEKHFRKQLKRFGDDTVVKCLECRRIQYLKFENGLRNGWSVCHGKTMPILYCKANIEKAVSNIVNTAKRDGENVV